MPGLHTSLGTIMSPRHPILPCLLPHPHVPPPSSQATFSRMVLSALTPFLGKPTRQVRSAPWSWAFGVRLSTEKWEVVGLVPWEERMAPIQEKVGAGHSSKEPLNTQMSVAWCPGSSVSGTKTSGFCVRARTERGHHPSWTGALQGMTHGLFPVREAGDGREEQRFHPDPVQAGSIPVTSR